jgi:hypothetical protein
MNSRKRGLLRFPAFLPTNLQQSTPINKEINMGLDMYAYSVDQSIVEGEGEVDVKVYSLARRATGFIDIDEDVLNEMDESIRKQYWSEYHRANSNAKERGLLNPEFYYWRKFNALHGWMHDLYISKGGVDEDFNCNTVRLTLEDLESLMMTAEKGRLKPTQGFFFGADHIEPEEIESVFDFAYKAKAEIAAGKAVFYDSWW